MARFNDIQITRGRIVALGTEIALNGVALDCTPYEAIMILKVRRASGDRVVLSKRITWIARALGTGRYELTADETARLAPRLHEFEAVVYDTATGAQVATYKTGYIDVIETLTLSPQTL